MTTVLLVVLFFAIWQTRTAVTIQAQASQIIKPVPKLVFYDNFSGVHLDATKWVTCYDWYKPVTDGCSNNGNHELEWYRSSQVAVSDGGVALTALPQPTLGDDGKVKKSYPYISGMISTGRPSWDQEPKWTGTYGYYEARMKLPAGKGIWPAFWLLPADKNWPPEIDVMEMLGDKPNQILQTYFWPDVATLSAKDTSTYTGVDYSKGWHTYAIDWRKGKIDWYIDNIKRKSVVSENVPSKPMEIIFNLAVGGKLPGNPDATTSFPASSYIDYVRVYDFKP